MIGEIIKILPLKKSRNEGDYKRVWFRMEDRKVLKTDLVKGFRNYWRWQKLLREGNRLFNLKIKKTKDGEMVDADSWPMLLNGQKISKDEFKTKEERDRDLVITAQQ